tara:strand:+ start:910 stop:1698 length:789 start_codon:yes stop_codon:yes gene_type:complete
MATEEMGAYKKKGAAESKYLSEDGDVIDQNKKTGGPAKGKAHMKKEVEGPGRGAKKGDQSATKSLDYEGPGRSSGYTQNFGPARVNGYTKGAAKVNSIMGRQGPAGLFDTIKKVGRTGLDIVKSVGVQGLDLISADPIRSDYTAFGDNRAGRSNAKNNKEFEQNVLDRVQNRSDSGSTYPIAGSISKLFNDTGWGKNIFGGDEPDNFSGTSSSRTANSAGIFPGLEVNSVGGTETRDAKTDKYGGSIGISPTTPVKKKGISG